MPCCSCMSSGICRRCSCVKDARSCEDCRPSRCLPSRCENSTANLQQGHNSRIRLPSHSQSDTNPASLFLSGMILSPLRIPVPIVVIIMITIMTVMMIITKSGLILVRWNIKVRVQKSCLHIL